MVSLRPRLVDVTITLAVAVAVQVAIATATEPNARAPQLVGHLLGVLVALPYLVVRRWPVAVAYTVTALLIVYYSANFRGFTPTLALIVALYFAAEHGRISPVLPVPVFFLLGAIFTGLRQHQDLLVLVNALLPHVALIAVAALLGALVRSRRTLAAETAQRLRLVAEERDREARRLVTEERLRIARELHDTVSHALATIAVQSGTALHVLDARPDQAREALTAIRRTGRQTLDELRATLGVLRASDESVGATDSSAGLDRLPALVDAVRDAGLRVTLRTDGTIDDLPPRVNHAAYRILQEALTNVLRHAGPDVSAQVDLRRHDDVLTIEVHDDGVGVPATGSPAGHGGHGIAGMRERAGALGGAVEAGPGERGFSVRARLPLGEVA
ncbi:MAG TPA: sensor histidine kinase [Micromonosporaceae bacterium]